MKSETGNKNPDAGRDNFILGVTSIEQRGLKESKGGNGIEMREIRVQENQHYEDVVYPTVNIVCSPRVYQQRIRADRISLTKFKERIYASNCKTSFEDDLVPTQFLSKFSEGDGMIYNMRDIRSKENNANPVGAIKILVCVCMYNESRHAINLTLEGIYKNLPHFEQAGISAGEVAVVLLQDGILKLVDDRQKRTLAKGKNSMVEFYR